MQHRATFFSVMLGVSILLSACVDKFTAGGTLPSAEGSGIANFGLVINLEKNHASGTYRDNLAGVHLRIVDIVEIHQTSPSCINVTLAYVSTNPAERGEGTVRSLVRLGPAGRLEATISRSTSLTAPLKTTSTKARSSGVGNNQAHN